MHGWIWKRKVVWLTSVILVTVMGVIVGAGLLLSVPGYQKYRGYQVKVR